MSLLSSHQHIIIGIILLIILSGLCTHHANEYEKHLKHPSYKSILSDYPQGELVNVYGTVTHINDDIHIQDEYHGQIVEMKIVNSTHILKNHTLSPNDKVTLVGVLGSDNQILRVHEMHVNKYENYIFVLVRSFLALAVLVYVFNSFWCFNIENFQFRRR